MYDSFANPSGMQGPGMQGTGMNPQLNPFGNALYGASSGILGAYGEKFLGSSSEFMQTNITRGNWIRVSEPVGGRLSYKPPIYDINAPDLYIPFMAFGTFVILAGLTLGFGGKFTPEALSFQFSKAFITWVLQAACLKGMLYSLGSGEVPLLDLAAYGGYLFVCLTPAVAARLIWSQSYYLLLPWMSLCMGWFLRNTMQRVLLVEMRRSSERHPTRQNYTLILMAAAQLPLLFFLGRIA